MQVELLKVSKIMSKKVGAKSQVIYHRSSDLPIIATDSDFKPHPATLIALAGVFFVILVCSMVSFLKAIAGDVKGFHVIFDEISSRDAHLAPPY